MHLDADGGAAHLPIFERLTLSLQLLASRLGESLPGSARVFGLAGRKHSGTGRDQAVGGRSLQRHPLLNGHHFHVRLVQLFFCPRLVDEDVDSGMAIPIAILGNAVRIIATGIASQYNPALVQGAAHEAFGYVSVLVAALGCVALHLTLTSVLKAWRANNDEIRHARSNMPRSKMARTRPFRSSVMAYWQPAA